MNIITDTHAPTSSGSDLPPLVTDRPPRVLIAGAGLGGLFLGILLEKAGIPYEIFERSAEPRPLGKLTPYTSNKPEGLHTPNILPAFEQLGLLDELMAFSKPARIATLYTDKLKVIGDAVPASADVIGYDRILFTRPELHDLLFKQIPSEKMHMSKKIVSFEHDNDGITLAFGDNSTARGDILVGADGAHSGVRKHLHEFLDKQGLLPNSDSMKIPRGYISLLGTTDALDPAKYPGVLKEDSESYYVIGDKDTPYTWVTFCVPGNRICWNVIIQLGVTDVADEQFKTSDWVPQQNKKMMDSIRHLKTPYGILGDLFDATQLDRVSKVYFEDMLFDTWNHGRTVLIGDGNGAGAVNAMQDAVILANHLYDIKPTSFENIEQALNDYKEDRFDAIKDQYPLSHMSAKLIYGHTLLERIFRYIIFNWMPKSIQMKQIEMSTAYRPQANFLPQAPRRGTLETTPQKPSKRIQNEDEEAKKRAAAAF
ncbi:hypothetical protein BGZ96_002800 [Linnemannia gamsii]|uniref:FAD-binding domain-containing protein n=1 Tax=Linnemannia gamsii TaxID=64522 RepID=A0ABQ7K9A3_9FUNG|nr:hypothetical protein BGZ96_002800 [Linnemannia gamsii]